MNRLKMMYPLDGNRYDAANKDAGDAASLVETGAVLPGETAAQRSSPAANWATTRVGERVSDEESGREAGTGTAPRYSRRLSDKILIAFHHACDQADFEVAEQLLGVLEMMLTRRPLSPDNNRRRSMESLVAAHERLWHLRHPTNRLD